MGVIKKAYSLVGQDGNAYSLLAYTFQAMRNAKRSKEYMDVVKKDATSGDYNNLICVLDAELNKINTEFNLSHDDEDECCPNCGWYDCECDEDESEEDDFDHCSGCGKSQYRCECE